MLLKLSKGLRKKLRIFFEKMRSTRMILDKTERTCTKLQLIPVTIKQLWLALKF